ncbi:MAG: FAD-linked oxidoreductase [Actinomycetia bacterium]|nr:FAD-linked oxidoreductase [Actinomycetes bacterium]
MLRRRDNVWRNWAGNQECAPAAVETPESVLEVRDAVRRAGVAGQRVKVVGTGHSFTAIACTDGRLLRLDRLDRVLDVDPDEGTVTVEGGMPLWKLNEQLALRDLALENLGDIDQQTIAGAIATSTHGTGRRFGGLATQVRGLELVTADGELLRCSPAEEPELFHCARVGLGALGIVTQVTLAVVPAYRLHMVERPEDFERVLAGLDAAVDTHDHYEVEHWFPHTDACLVKELDRTDAPLRPRSTLAAWRDDILLGNYVFGGICAIGKRSPERIPQLARFATTQLGRTDLVDRSDRVFCSPRLIKFVEMEYAINRADAALALRRVRDLIDDEDLRISIPLELRFAAADDIPLSTAHGRETAYLAVHVYRGMPYEEYFRGVEAIMDELDGRPHWGKLHWQTAATLAPRYPEWDRFAAARHRLDPDGTFANEYLDRVLGPA